MKIFGYEFKHLSDSHIEDLRNLEREGSIYTDHWIDGLDDFRHVRIRFANSEIKEYVRSLKALDLFLGSGATWAREVKGIPEDIAARADAYQMHTINGEILGPPWQCPAAFYGPALEKLICFSGRAEVLEEQGTAAFLSTIRRAIDALTPAIRCFGQREKGLVAWPVAREDDVRDLLYIT